MKYWGSAFLLFVLVLSVLFLGACSTPVATETDGVLEAPITSAVNDDTESQTEPVLAADAADATSNGEETGVIADDTDETTQPDGWSDETHGKSADPNYEVVFPQDAVNTMTITIDPDDWQAMIDDMTAAYGEPASGSGRGGRPGGAGQGGGGTFTTGNPIWVAATIQFEGDIWTDVGVRFKGNSSLKDTWSSGSIELPFKLDFDEFEDENPAIQDQRFYGFKQLSLSNNYKDPTFMRDAVTSDIFTEAGIACAETAFYELHVDYGEGPVSFGLYTMIEVIDDTVIDRFFGNDDGNIYEADGPAASLAQGTLDGITTSFEKENNKDEADWGDIEALYSVLHSDTRQTDPDAWSAELEAVFDVDTFLHWLAINTVIGNWDTYGGMTHNFYLYNNPDTGQLTWIPWDHNEALGENRRSSMTLGMDAIGAEWPLISYLLTDSEYYDIYTSYIDETITTVFEADVMAAKYQEIANLIEPYAAEKIGADAFTRAVQDLVDYTYARSAAAERFWAQSD